MNAIKELSTVNEKLLYQNKVELLYRDLVLSHQRKWSFIHLKISINELIVEGQNLRFDYELCPYEILWEEVLNSLKR